MLKTITRQRAEQLAHRKHLAALVRYFYTGEWVIPHSPVLPDARLAWQSTAAPGTILARSR